MALSALSSIALFSPIIASNVIFSARRAAKGADSMEENPIYGAANINIAGAQILKGARAVKALAVAADPLLENINKGAKLNILQEYVPKKTNILLKNPALETAGRILDTTTRYINPVIVGTSAFNVATSKDKVDTWARESTSLLTMFGAEAFAKDLVGMPSFNTVNGKNKVNFRQARGTDFVKKLLSKEQCNAIQKALNKNKATKLAVSAGKGLVFAGSSILGYKAGNKISDAVLGEKEDT